jgi:hypothetical protein
MLYTIYETWDFRIQTGCTCAAGPIPATSCCAVLPLTPTLLGCDAGDCRAAAMASVFAAALLVNTVYGCSATRFIALTTSIRHNVPFVELHAAQTMLHVT